MEKLSLNDNGTQFDVTLLKSERPTCTALFSVGSGGNPERHLALMQRLVAAGCTLVAPHFERLASPRPTETELLLRARRLRIALDSVARPSLPVIGIGHSIGASMLLALAGAEIWLGANEKLPIKPDERLSRLVLLTPATLFFQAPSALTSVQIPMQVWAGTKDVITPPAQSEMLRELIQSQSPVDLRIIEGAGHFSFINTLPPQTVDPLADREAFLEELASEICRFAIERPTTAGE